MSKLAIIPVAANAVTIVLSDGTELKLHEGIEGTLSVMAADDTKQLALEELQGDGSMKRIALADMLRISVVDQGP